MDIVKCPAGVTIRVQHVSIEAARRFYALRRAGICHLEAAGWTRAEWSYT